MTDAFPPAGSPEFEQAFWDLLPSKTPFLSALARTKCENTRVELVPNGPINVTQIMRKTVESHADRKAAVFEIVKKVRELKMDMEWALLNNGEPAFGTSTAARQLGGLRWFEPLKADGETWNPKDYALAILRGPDMVDLKGMIEGREMSLLLIEFTLLHTAAKNDDA